MRIANIQRTMNLFMIIILIKCFYLSNNILGTGNANRNTKTNASGKGRKYQKTFRNVAK